MSAKGFLLWAFAAQLLVSSVGRSLLNHASVARRHQGPVTAALGDGWRCSRADFRNMGHQVTLHAERVPGPAAITAPFHPKDTVVHHTSGGPVRHRTGGVHVVPKDVMVLGIQGKDAVSFVVAAVGLGMPIRLHHCKPASEPTVRNFGINSARGTPGAGRDIGASAPMAQEAGQCCGRVVRTGWSHGGFRFR